MNEIFVQLAFEIIFIFLIISAVFLTIIKVVREKNRIDLVLIVLLVTVAFISILKIQKIMNLALPFHIGYRLNNQTIGVLIYLGVLMELMFYIKGAKRYYTLPIVIGLYTVIMLINFQYGFFFNIFTFVIGAISFTILMIEGVKNRNGIPIGVATLTILIGLAQIFELISIKFNIFSSICKIVGIFVMMLGTSGFINKYFLVDKESEKKIQNIWISRMVIKENRLRK